MRASPWSIGVLMLFLSVLAIATPFAPRHVVQPSGIVAAAILAIGGFFLLAMRRPWSFWIALAAAAITAALGGASIALNRTIGLDPPIVSLLAGIYLTVRVLIARPAFTALAGHTKSTEADHADA